MNIDFLEAPLMKYCQKYLLLGIAFCNKTKKSIVFRSKFEEITDFRRVF